MIHLLTVFVVVLVFFLVHPLAGLFLAVLSAILRKHFFELPIIAFVFDILYTPADYWFFGLPFSVSAILFLILLIPIKKRVFYSDVR